MRISDWSSDVCSSDLGRRVRRLSEPEGLCQPWRRVHPLSVRPARDVCGPDQRRSLQKAAARISQELLFRYVDLRTGSPEISCELEDRKSTRLNSSHYCASRMQCSVQKQEQDVYVIHSNETQTE